MIRRAAREVGRIALLVAILCVAVSGLGLLLTRVLNEWWPLTIEERLPARLARGRTEAMTDFTAVFSFLGRVEVVAATAAVIVFGLWLAQRRWREPVFLAFAVAVQAGVLLSATFVVDRDPPPVRRLDDASAAASYPASAVALAAVLYTALALIVGWRMRSERGKVAAMSVCLAVPLLVAYSELYRGTAHPSDVGAAFASAYASIAIAHTGVVRRRWQGGARPDPSRIPRSGGAQHRAAIIYNPTKVPDFPGLKQRVEEFMRTNGWGTPLWLETTRDDPGISACERAVEDKVDVVFVCGGDGTVMAAVTALAGRDMPMAILPAGTGNLLARNLGLPLDDEEETLRIGLTGRDRLIDVAAVEGRKFAVMAGMGLDAAIMRDARPGLKKAMGWPAYIVSAGMHIRGEGWRVALTLDGGTTMHRRVRTVVVGNVGRLQANIPLLPEAEPDDGLLDVVLLAPKGTLDWARIIGLVLTERLTRDRRVERFRAQHVLIETLRPQPRQLDGDLIPDGTSMDIQIEKLALCVRVRP